MKKQFSFIVVCMIICILFHEIALGQQSSMVDIMWRPKQRIIKNTQIFKLLHLEGEEYVYVEKFVNQGANKKQRILEQYDANYASPQKSNK